MKKISIVVTMLCLLASMQGYAQKGNLVKQSLQALTGGVPSAFSQEVAVVLERASLAGTRITSAQFTLANTNYLPSTVLFDRVAQNGGLRALSAEDVQALGQKFEGLDDIVKTKSSPYAGYRGALLSAAPTGRPEVLLNKTVGSMTDLLDLQHYMQFHGNQFPHLFTVTSNGWLLPTDCLASREGNAAFRQVLNLLIRQQAGLLDEAIVSQLVALHAQASNPVALQTVVEQLMNWRAAHNTTTLAPRLPHDLTEVSLRSDAETLWLTMEIRLLQLTPGIELPEVLKTAQVTQ